MDRGVSSLSAGVATFFIVAVFVILAVPLPLWDIATPFGHTALIAVVLGVSMAGGGLMFLAGFRTVTLTPPWGWAGAPLLAAAAVSAVAAGSGRFGWWGFGFEEGSVGFLILAAAVTYAASVVPRAFAGRLLSVAAGACALGAGIFLSVLATGGAESVAEHWPRASFLSAAGLLLAALLWKPVSGWRARVLYAAVAVVSGTAFVLLFHPAVGLALVVALGVPLALAAVSAGGTPLPLAPAAVALMVVGLFFAGVRAPLLSVPPEVRPSLELTQAVAGNAYGESLRTMLFGSGPRSFADIWERHRLPELNRSIFWEEEFEAGYSSAITLFVTLGVFGLLCFLLYLGIAALFAVRVATAGEEGRHALVSACVAAAVFCLLALSAAVPGPAAYVLGGAALGFAARLLQAERIVRIGRGLLRGLLVALPLIGGGAALTSVALLQLAAARAHTQGLEYFVEGAVEDAAPRLTHAAELWAVQQYQRDAARARLESIFAELAELPDTQSFAEEEFHTLTQEVRGLSDSAASGRLTEWRSWLACSSLYLSLYTAAGPDYAPQYRSRVEDCLEFASHAAPSRPDVPYARARAAVVFNEEDAVRAYLAEALRLKPDYAPALELQQALGQ